ncbi:hypothetical protein HZA96_04465 [Candidatus Woesearchaeota archaeon]|nr:hypothetical protein [Candidatus Woesearchaeota archaeon]
MELVLDANILVSALVKDSHTRHFLLLSGHSFYAPEFILAEISEHIKELESKTELSESELKMKTEISTILRDSKLMQIRYFNHDIPNAVLIYGNNVGTDLFL